MLVKRYSRIGFSSLLLLILFLSGSETPAQDTSSVAAKDSLFWINLGLGGGVFKEEFSDNKRGISIGGSFSRMSGNRIISIRGVVIRPDNSNATIFESVCGTKRMWDFGVLYGFATRSRSGFASISAGAGIVGETTQRNGTLLSMGLPLETQLFYTPGSLISLGIYGFADINYYHSFAGFLLCLRLDMSG